MEKSEAFSVGKITKSHGLKGEVIIWLDVDQPQNYQNLKVIFLEIKGHLIPYIVEQIQIRGTKSILKLGGIDRLEATPDIINAECYLPLTQLPVLKSDQFYYHEVIGYELLDEEKPIGLLKAIYQGVGQDLFAIEVNEVEILIPIVNDFIQKIDKENRKIILNLPEGLVNIYLQP